ncbi:unnamed protein product [Rhizophagus irregularis]|nr:unnamed protein product [Rhizophagus irregularis]
MELRRFVTSWNLKIHNFLDGTWIELRRFWLYLKELQRFQLHLKKLQRLRLPFERTSKVSGSHLAHFENPGISCQTFRK